MKQRFTILLLTLMFASAGASFATDRLVDPSALGAADAGDCSVTPCLTIGYALSQALQGDTIIIAGGEEYAEGELDITLPFLTVRSDFGSDVAVGAGGRFTPSTPGVDACNAAEACINTDGFDYAFSIQANNVTIEGLEILGDADDLGAEDTYAGIVINGGYDRWTIRHNVIHNIGQKLAASSFNHAYGVYADAQTTSGSASMTGGEIRGNHLYDLGGVNVGGIDVTAGVGAHVEGLTGDVTECDAISKFACGAWIHGNVLFDLARGLNIDNFTEFVDGREQAVGFRVLQDAQNVLPNNGARVNDNTYAAHTPNGTLLDVGVFMDMGGSSVEETNTTSFAGSGVVAYVQNAGRKATIDELALAPFFKSSNPNPQSMLGPDSDTYFVLQATAEDNSADDATIVHLLGTQTVGVDDFQLEVFPGGNGTSYKVSLDNDGDLNVREGARLLYDGASFVTGSTDGVAVVLFNGTVGDDLLTLDFANGNPIPEGGQTACLPLEGTNSSECGIQFDGDDGYDKIVLRGSEQVNNQTYAMGNGPQLPSVASDEGSGSIYFEPATIGVPTVAPAVDYTPGMTSIVNFLNIEPIDDVVITNGVYSVVAYNGVDHEFNLVDGPTVFGAGTFQLNSGAVDSFELINFRNKKNVRAYGGDGDDIIQSFTTDGEAPALLNSVRFYGEAGNDYIVVRPSEDYTVSVYGGAGIEDWFFLDCAGVAGCDPSMANAVVPAGGTITGFTSAEDVVVDGNFEMEAFDYDAASEDFSITKSVDVYGSAHPGDVISFTVEVEHVAGTNNLDLSALGDELWVTDVIDHRFSLNEQSVVVTAGSVDITNNRAMLWRIDDNDWDVNETFTMTYDVIVNTLITTEDIDNWTSILNDDDNLAFNHAMTSVDLANVFGFPAKAEIQASVFAPTDAGPRYIVGLYGGALDPATLNIGPVMCRVPDQNKAAGWDGGLGNLWYSCGEGLPAKDGLFSPLVVTDLFRDQSGRIWLTSWGFGGLYYSDDDGKTWTDPFLDLTGGPGGAPDGIDDPFAQVYAITEDIIGTLYISANNGDMYRSFDGGGTWQKAKQLPLGSADTPWSLEADPTAPGKLYAGTFGDSLYVTTNFGETWQKPEGNGLGNGHIFDIEFDPVSGNIFVGTALGVYYTADEGDNWNGLNTAFPEPNVPPEVRHVSFDENGVLYIGTWGQGVWVSSNWQATALDEFALQVGQVQDLAVMDGGVFVLSAGAEMMRFDGVAYSSSVDTEDEGPAQVPTTYALEQNYPNPFNPTTTIEFALPATSEVSLAVYDMLGRRVALLVNGQLTTGQHRIQFNASSLPSGMYLYRLTTPTGAVTKKMMLIK